MSQINDSLILGLLSERQRRFAALGSGVKTLEYDWMVESADKMTISYEHMVAIRLVVDHVLVEPDSIEGSADSKRYCGLIEDIWTLKLQDKHQKMLDIVPAGVDEVYGLPLSSDLRMAPTPLLYYIVPRLIGACAVKYCGVLIDQDICEKILTLCIDLMDCEAKRGNAERVNVLMAVVWKTVKSALSDLAKNVFGGRCAEMPWKQHKEPLFDFRGVELPTDNTIEVGPGVAYHWTILDNATYQVPMPDLFPGHPWLTSELRKMRQYGITHALLFVVSHITFAFARRHTYALANLNEARSILFDNRGTQWRHYKKHYESLPSQLRDFHVSILLTQQETHAHKQKDHDRLVQLDMDRALRTFYDPYSYIKDVNPRKRQRESTCSSDYTRSSDG